MTKYFSQFVAAFFIILSVSPSNVWASSAERPLMRPDLLEAYIDGLIHNRMRAKNMTAATISIVKDGKVILAKGYGFANLEPKQVVDPAQSRFRVGSVSKLFTYTAIMQLYEQGLIDLDQDANRYLKGIQIADHFKTPITIRHLLTHTAGFEDSALGGYMDRSASERLPLLHALKQYQPARMWEAGKYIAYSNYGAGLLGGIVESVTGEDFPSYVEKNIFRPLGMENSSFAESDDRAFLADHVTAYKRESGKPKPLGFEYIGSWAPAGSMSSTARDMALFMIAHLNNGSGVKGRILSESTIAQMHSRAFTHSKALPGMAHGFFEGKLNGENTLWHSGATSHFFSNLALLPERKIGIFYSFTGGKAAEGIEDPAKNIVNYFFPQEAARGYDPKAVSLSAYEGSFRSMRMVQTDAIKAYYMLDEVVFAASEDDNTLIMERDGKSQRFIPVGKQLFVNTKNSQKLYFIEGPEGTLNHIQWSEKPYYNFERIKWYETSSFNIVMLLICILLLVSALIKARYGWHRNASLPLSGKSIVTLMVISCIFSIGLLMAIVLVMTTQRFEYDGITFATKLVTAIALFMVPLSAINFYQASNVWCLKHWNIATRIHHSLIVAVLIYLTWFLHHWNLMSFIF
ncbi:MAG: serine hydrolase domain-containing protein [Kordiimonas sp.]